MIQTHTAWKSGCTIRLFRVSLTTPHPQPRPKALLFRPARFNIESHLSWMAKSDYGTMGIYTYLVFSNNILICVCRNQISIASSIELHPIQNACNTSTSTLFYYFVQLLDLVHTFQPSIIVHLESMRMTPRPFKLWPKSLILQNMPAPSMKQFYSGEKMPM